MVKISVLSLQTQKNRSIGIFEPSGEWFLSTLWGLELKGGFHIYLIFQQRPGKS